MSGKPAMRVAVLWAACCAFFGCSNAPEPVRQAPGAEPSADPLRALGLRHPPAEVARAILELAQIRAGDRVVILGCGDGGVPAAAALSRRAKVVAVDPSAEAITLARETARKAGVEGDIEFREEPPARAELSGAAAVVILLPRNVAKEIEGKLRSELAPGARVIAWIPALVQLGSPEEQGGALHFYRVPGDTHAKSLAPYVRTPLPVVAKMLEMAKIEKGDVLYDLGCGDGRIVVEAAKKYGIRAVGVDFDSRRIEEARELARREGVEALTEFRQEDILETDISPATVVTLFLLPDSNRILKPKLAKLRDGARILSHQFDTEGWPYRKKETMVLPEGSAHTIYLWEMSEDLRRAR